MNKNSIIPKSWRESFSELKEDISHSVERWLGRLKPEERREAEHELTLADFWQRPFDFDFSQPKVNLDEDDDTITNEQDDETTVTSEYFHTTGVSVRFSIQKTMSDFWIKGNWDVPEEYDQIFLDGGMDGL